MKKYAFVFDMDGVIIDSNPYHRISLQQFCEKHGYHLSEAELRTKIYGRTNKEWIPRIFGELSTEEIARLGAEKELLYCQLYANEIQPVKGLVDFLKQMDIHKIVRAIGTSAPRANVDFTLIKTVTVGFFHTILDESDVSHGKPDPEIYLKVAAALRLPPQECIVFEDSLSGVEAAKAAGCKVVGITTTHTSEELSATDYVIDDFDGLDPLLLMDKV